MPLLKRRQDTSLQPYSLFWWWWKLFCLHKFQESIIWIIFKLSQSYPLPLTLNSTIMALVRYIVNFSIRVLRFVFQNCYFASDWSEISRKGSGLTDFSLCGKHSQIFCQVPVVSPSLQLDEGFIQRSFASRKYCLIGRPKTKNFFFLFSSLNHNQQMPTSRMQMTFVLSLGVGLLEMRKWKKWLSENIKKLTELGYSHISEWPDNLKWR